MLKKTLFKGTLILTLAGLASRIIGFFYRIFLSRAIGAAGLGVLGLAMPLQSLVLSAFTVGMQAAVSRFCASCLALGRKKEAQEHFILGTAFSVTASLLAALVLFLHAPFFAVEILKEEQTLPLIRILAAGLPLGALHSCISSYYYAQKQTAPPALFQLLEQGSRVGSSYLIWQILLSQGKSATPAIAAAGALFGEIAACTASGIAVGIHLHAFRFRLLKIEAPARKLLAMLKMALPHSLNRLLVTLLTSIEMILIPVQLQKYGLSSEDALEIYGIFTGMVLPLLLFPATVTNSASVMLMPSIAELAAKGEQKRIRNVAGRISFACFLMGTFCCFFFTLSGGFLGNLLFSSPSAGIYIRSLSFLCPFLYLNGILTSILNGLGKPESCLFHSVSGTLIRLAAVVFLIPKIGIRGYFYGMLLSEIMISLLHLFTLRTTFSGKFSIDKRQEKDYNGRLKRKERE